MKTKTYAGLTSQDLLKICQNYAKTKGGKCLSIEYIDSKSKLLWECEFGHTWSAIPTNVKRGKWCSVCSNNKKLTLDDCKSLAESRGGQCLSDTYKNSGSPLTWECKYGHTWKASHNSIKSVGSWCPECSASVGERICRSFFEQFFGDKFPNSKPKWLTKGKSRLELDGFNEKLGIAFEYQGYQHFLIDRKFTKTQEALEKRMDYDNLKKDLCKSNNVVLVEIKEFDNITDITNIISYLTFLLVHMNGFTTPNNNIKIDIYSLYSNKIDEFKALATERGGECLSDVYINYDSKLKWKCAKGHVWETIGYFVRKGSWCPYCAEVKKGEKFPNGRVAKLLAPFKTSEYKREKK